MADKCGKCREDTSDNKRVECDGCSTMFHYSCTELTASEIRVIELKKRVLKYLCETCQQGMKLIPLLKKNLDALDERFESFKASISLKLDNLSNDYRDTPAVCAPNIMTPEMDSASSEEVIKEVTERQTRKNNIMIFNLKENPQISDATAVQRIFRQMCDVLPTVIKIDRIGRPNKNNIKALKITLSNHDEVQQIVKNKSKLDRLERIYISTDLTKRQQEEFKKVKKELDQRRSRGEEDWIIRYVNGSPKIVKKN